MGGHIEKHKAPSCIPWPGCPSLFVSPLQGGSRTSDTVSARAREVSWTLSLPLWRPQTHTLLFCVTLLCPSLSPAPSKADPHLMSVHSLTCSCSAHLLWAQACVGHGTQCPVLLLGCCRQANGRHKQEGRASTAERREPLTEEQKVPLDRVNPEEMSVSWASEL